jgi:DNA-binding MarR family transcriptional regulator
LDVDPQLIKPALEQLQERSLVATQDDGTIALTAAGRDAYERLIAARCAGLRELLAGWDPEAQPEIKQMVERLGRDLVSEIPLPPDVPVTARA